MGEAGLLPLPYGRRPELDAAALKRSAKWAQAELQRACEIPVPPDLDRDPNLVHSDGARGESGAATEEGHAAVEEGTAAPEERGAGAGAEGELAAGTDEGELSIPGGSNGCRGSQADFHGIQGTWVSDKGEISIFEDRRTSRLSYEEPLDEGNRLHGFLSKLDVPLEPDVQEAWQAALCILEDDELPWYGPSYGEEPESVGDIQVRFRLGPPPTLETRIRVADVDDDWQPPMTLRRPPARAAPAAAEAASGGDRDMFVFGRG